MGVKLRVERGRGGPVAAAGEGEESPHSVRPGVEIGGRAWGHSPEPIGYLREDTVMADGPVASFQNHKVDIRLSHVPGEGGNNLESM